MIEVRKCHYQGRGVKGQQRRTLGTGEAYNWSSNKWETERGKKILT